MEMGILTGRTDTHLVSLEGSTTRVHRDMAPAFRALRDEAATAGFDLRIVSAFRDYATQLRIWNDKATGKRPLLDDRSRPLEFASLRPEQIVFAILRWSALPGASRHHWGSDIDVVDGRAMPEGYKVQLVPAEVEAGGLFAPLHDWLDGALPRFGFFRPYAEDRGGVSPERWHLSYRPVAEPCFAAYDLPVLETVLRTGDMALKDVALANAKTIFQRYVRNITPPSHVGAV